MCTLDENGKKIKWNKRNPVNSLATWSSCPIYFCIYHFVHTFAAFILAHLLLSSIMCVFVCVRVHCMHFYFSSRCFMHFSPSSPSHIALSAFRTNAGSKIWMRYFFFCCLSQLFVSPVLMLILYTCTDKSINNFWTSRSKFKTFERNQIYYRERKKSRQQQPDNGCICRNRHSSPTNPLDHLHIWGGCALGK